jgi:hypothetical protein
MSVSAIPVLSPPPERCPGKYSKELSWISTLRLNGRPHFTPPKQSEEAQMPIGNLPEVLSREEWLTARKELLAKEKELTRNQP